MLALHKRCTSIGNALGCTARFFGTRKTKPLIQYTLPMLKPERYQPNSIEAKTKGRQARLAKLNEMNEIPTYDKELQLEAQALFSQSRIDDFEQKYGEMNARYTEAVRQNTTLQNELDEALNEMKAVRLHAQSQVAESSFQTSVSMLQSIALLLPHAPESVIAQIPFLHRLPLVRGEVLSKAAIELCMVDETPSSSKGENYVIEEVFNQGWVFEPADDGFDRPGIIVKEPYIRVARTSTDVGDFSKGMETLDRLENYQ